MIARRLAVGVFVGLASALAFAPGALAQSTEGVVMAAYGGGNGDTWRTVVGAPFTAETKTPVKITDLPNTEAAIRASASNPQYNVAWVGYFQAVTLFKDGLIETFDPKDFPEISKVPERFVLKAPDGRLLGIPVQFQYYGIAFNTQQAKSSDFDSWMALADPKWAGKLAQAQAFVAGSYDLVMYAKIAGGDESNVAPGLPAFSAFTKNSMTIMSSFAQGNTLLTRGEVAAAPFYSARIRSLKKDSAPVDIAIPKEGAILIPYILVVPKNAKNQDAYTAFLKHAMKPDVQLKMYDYAGYIPFNTSAQLSDKQVSELGMPLINLIDRLYAPDSWKLSDNLAKSIKLVEELQAKK